MKRSKPLRRTGLKRPTAEQVRAWQESQREKLIARARVEPRAPRKPIPQIGAKTRREASAWAACKREVRLRSGGWCEANVEGVCPPGRHPGIDSHHLVPEDRDAGRHEPERVRLVCRAAHDHIHAHPGEAKRLGLLRPDSLADI